MTAIDKAREYEKSDALYYVRKSMNRVGVDDEKRLKDMELYLNVALGLCGKIRERWEK